MSLIQSLSHRRSQIIGGKTEMSLIESLSDLRSHSSSEVEPLPEKCPIYPWLTRSDDDNHNDLGNHDEDENHSHLRFIVTNFAIIA